MSTIIPIEKAQSVLQQILETLVKEPEKVVIESSHDEAEDIFSLTVSVSQNDMGLIIGKSGRTSQSIRSIMHIVGRSVGIILRIEFLEADGRIMYKDTYPFTERSSDGYNKNGGGYSGAGSSTGGYNGGGNRGGGYQSNNNQGNFSRQYGQRGGSENRDTQDHYVQRRNNPKQDEGGYDPLQIDLN